jgi:hypothetical protein
VLTGRADFGSRDAAADRLDPETVAAAIALVDERVAVLADRIKAARDAVPLIAVGGGAALIPDGLPGVSKVLRHRHADLANAIGAAVAEARAPLTARGRIRGRIEAASGPGLRSQG